MPGSVPVMTGAPAKYGRFLLDRGASGVLAVCLDCHAWRSGPMDPAAALTAAARHEANAHPRSTYARNALLKREARRGCP